MKKVIVLLADGFEDVEAVTPIDFLRRAEMDVLTAGVTGTRVVSAHGIPVEVDVALSEIGGEVDAVVIPGGRPGADNIADSSQALDLIRMVFSDGGLIAAICASPGMILSKVSVLNGKKATCYPGFQEYFPEDAVYLETPVVADGNLITSRGPGTAADFSIEIIRYLLGDECADAIHTGTLMG